MIRLPLKAEWRILRSRTTAWLAAALSLAAGTIAPLILISIHYQASSSESQGLPIVNMVGSNAADIAGRALWVHNLYIIPLVLLMVACASIAEDRNNNCLRDISIRAISRSQLLLVRILSNAGLAGICTVLTFVPALVIGGIYFKSIGSLPNIFLANLLSWMSDMAIIGMGMLVATFAASAGRAAIYTLLLLLGERIIRVILQLSGPIFSFKIPEELLTLFPGHALEAWSGWSTGWSFSAIFGLFLLNIILYFFLFRRFQKLQL